MPEVTCSCYKVIDENLVRSLEDSIRTDVIEWLRSKLPRWTKACCSTSHYSDIKYVKLHKPLLSWVVEFSYVSVAQTSFYDNESTGGIR